MASKTLYSNTPHSDGQVIGETAAATVAFHGATAVAQRAGTAGTQAAVATTAFTVGGSYSQSEVTAIATRATALTVLVNELRAALVEKGLIKGSDAA